LIHREVGAFQRHHFKAAKIEGNARTLLAKGTHIMGYSAQALARYQTEQTAQIREARRITEEMTGGTRSDYNGEAEKAYQKCQGEISRLGELITSARRDADDDAANEKEEREFEAAAGKHYVPHNGHAQGAGWSERAAAAIVGAQEERALNSGSIDIDAPLNRLAVKPAVPTRVFDLLAHVPAPADANSTDYLRQTVRTNNAAFVPDSGLKPTSVYTIAEISDRLRVVSHLSEKIPVRYLSDRPALQRFMEAEMEGGVLAKLEDVIVNGNGVGEEFTGLVSLAGTPVTFATSAVQTTSNALMAQLDVGEFPTAFILRSTDWQSITLERASTGGPWLNGNPVDVKARTLHGLPVVFSPTIPAGFSLLGDFSQADIMSKDATVTWDGSGEGLFNYNLTVLRAEIRAVLRCYRPAAFRYVDISV
jgi:HK97 family phage major capsid protein